MRISVTQLRGILKPYAYKIAYLPYHSRRDLGLYARRRDAVSKREHLTLLTPSGHVMGRLHGLTKQRQFLSAAHWESVVAAFERYEIPHQKRILKELDALKRP